MEIPKYIFSRVICLSHRW